MFVKEVSTDSDVVNFIRDEMISGKMTQYRRNYVIDYLERMVSKFRRCLYIPHEIIAMRHLIEDLCDVEVFEDIDDVSAEMLEESLDYEAFADELNVLDKYNEDEGFDGDIRKEAEVPIEAEVSN